MELKDVIDLKVLIDFLEKEDPETEYSYFDNFDCLWSRVCKHHGLEVCVGGDKVYTMPIEKWTGIELPTELDLLAQQIPHTYAGALKRAYALRDA